MIFGFFSGCYNYLLFWGGRACLCSRFKALSSMAGRSRQEPEAAAHSAATTSNTFLHLHSSGTQPRNSATYRRESSYLHYHTQGNPPEACPEASAPRFKFPQADNTDYHRGSDIHRIRGLWRDMVKKWTGLEKGLPWGPQLDSSDSCRQLVTRASSLHNETSNFKFLRVRRVSPCPGMVLHIL